MHKVARFLSFASGLWKLVAHYPAATAAIANVIIVVAADLGFHLTVTELTTVASIVAVVFGALVHSGVVPLVKVKGNYVPKHVGK